MPVHAFRRILEETKDADGGAAESADKQELYKQVPELITSAARANPKLRAHFWERFF